MVSKDKTKDILYKIYIIHFSNWLLNIHMKNLLRISSHIMPTEFMNKDRK